MKHNLGDLESHIPTVPAVTKLDYFLSSSELPGPPLEIGGNQMLITSP